MGLYGGSGFKIKKIDTRVNIGPNINYSTYIDVINHKESFSKNLNAGIGLGLNKSKEKKYDLSLRNDINYNISSTAQNNTKTHYINTLLYLDATVYIHKVWSLRTDYQYTYRQKTQQFSKNINTNFWNARLQRTFKQDEFTAYFLVRDILNQNVGIDRSFNSNRYTETINDRLKRYFMIGFTWDFKNKAPKPKETPSNK
jgi:hypothetical protein